MNNEKKKEDFKKACMVYAEGHWTKDPPIQSGVYPLFVQTVKGSSVCPSNFLFVTKLDSDITYSTVCGHSSDFSDVWQGYVWSKPMPLLPNIE